MSRTLTGIATGLTLIVIAGGCVERVIRINSDPPGARVFLNDEEIGVTPAKTHFLWYGDYDVILRKDGYETLKTHHQIEPPWYQYPPIDLIAECLIVTTIRDEHDFPTYTLTPAVAPPVEDVVRRAIEAREAALTGGE